MIKWIAKSSFWICIKQVITVAIGIFIISLLARNFSMEIFGKYQLILAILSILSIFSLSGMNTSLITSISKGFDGNYKTVKKIKFLASFIGAFGLFCTGIFFLITKEYLMFWTCAIISLIFPFMYHNNIWQSMLIAKEKFKALSISTIIFSLFNGLLITLSILIFKNNLITLCLAYTLSTIIGNYIIYKFTRYYISNTNKDKRTYQYGIFMTFISIVNIIADNIDKLLIGYFIGIPELAIYSLGMRAFSTAKNGTKNFLTILSKKIATNNTMQWKYYIPIFIISCIGVVIGYFILPYIMTLLFTDKYIMSIPIAQISIIFLPFFIIKILAKNHFIFNTRNKKVLFKSTIVIPLIKIILMIPGLYFFGIYGLAFIIGFQHIIELIFMYLIRKEY